MISIHALVKRATAFIMDVEYVNNISIHALVKRATEVLCKTSAKLNISIHALVKRATYFTMFGYAVNTLFQSTPS